MTDRPRSPRDPFWISAVAVVVMIVGARLIRAYTPLGHNLFAAPFDLLAALGDLLIHLVIFFAVLIPLRAAWRHTRVAQTLGTREQT